MQDTRTVKTPGQVQKVGWGGSFSVEPRPEMQAAENGDMTILAYLAYMAFCTPGAGGSAKKTRQGGHLPPFLRTFRQGAQWSMTLWKHKTQPALGKVLETIPGIAAGYKISPDIANNVNWTLRHLDDKNEPATMGEANHLGVQPVDVTPELLEAMRKLDNAQAVEVWKEQEAWRPHLVPKCTRYDHPDEGVYFELGCFKTRGPGAPSRSPSLQTIAPLGHQASGGASLAAIGAKRPAAGGGSGGGDHDTKRPRCSQDSICEEEEEETSTSIAIDWSMDSLNPAQLAFANGFLSDGGGTRSGAGGKGKGDSSWWDQGDESRKRTQKKASPPAVQALTYLAKTIVSSVRGSWKLCWERVKMS
jgi:hypothetical protein